tara:strand:- start:1821 stop:2054 length:234 start_codon:yes stop_codon:yes gene_type:complete
MALTDGEKDALEWASLVPGLLRAVGGMTGDTGFNLAADALSKVPLEQIGEELGKLRTDHISIDKGTMSIGDDVDVSA